MPGKINVSVVSYDEKYKTYAFFDYKNGGIHPYSYYFLSTKVPAENKVEFIACDEDFITFQDE